MDNFGTLKFSESLTSYLECQGLRSELVVQLQAGFKSLAFRTIEFKALFFLQLEKYALTGFAQISMFMSKLIRNKHNDKPTLKVNVSFYSFENRKLNLFINRCLGQFFREKNWLNGFIKVT